MSTTEDQSTGLEDIGDIVREVIRCVAPEPIEVVQSGDDLVADLGYHSLARVELMFALEDLFELRELTPEQAATMTTVEAIDAYVCEQIQRGAGQAPTREQVLEIIAVDD